MCNSKRITPGVTWTYPLSNVSREREREREREFVRVLKVEHRFAFTRGKFQGKQKGRQNGALGLNHSLLTP